ncbi:MAG: alternative ribosome rescue aminoacyl-tRNA hydrolase ArfB [Myxococcota bacterium]
MSDDLYIHDDLTIPHFELWFTATTSGGPGGQHANKTASRVTLHFAPEHSSVLSSWQKERLARKLSSRITADGVLQVSAGDERSQHRNRELARARMAEVIREGLRRPKRRKRTRPSLSSKRRRLEHKRRRGELKKTRKTPTRQDWER